MDTPQHASPVVTGTRFTQDTMVNRGWRETEGDDWDMHWAERDWIHEV